MSTRTPSTVRLLITVQKTGLGAVSSHRSYSPLPVSFSFFFLSSPHSSHSSLQVDPLARFRSIADATPTKPRVLITGSLGQLGRGLNTVYKYMYGDVVTMTDIVKVPADATDVCKSAFFLPHVGEVIHQSSSSSVFLYFSSSHTTYFPSSFFNEMYYLRCQF